MLGKLGIGVAVSADEIRAVRLSTAVHGKQMPFAVCSGGRSLSFKTVWCGRNRSGVQLGRVEGPGPRVGFAGSQPVATMMSVSGSWPMGVLQKASAAVGRR